MTGFDRARIEAAVAEILAAIGEDPSRPGLTATPSRVADAYAEFFSGVGVDARQQLGEPVPLEDAHAETVILRDIEFRSVCEHHLLPFLGVAHVAYLPGDAVIGLGRIPRVIETLSSRPQLQERLTEQISQAIMSEVGAKGVGVMMEAKHLCMMMRGVEKQNSVMVTSSVLGVFRDNLATREEFLNLVGR